jgi:signal transduction histidine kinase
VRLRHKLVALCIVVAAAPIATAGLLTVRWNEDALEAEIRARHEAVAHHAAQAVDADMRGLVASAQRTARILPWETLTGPELDGALRLVAQQDGRVVAVALYRGRGELVGIQAPPDHPWRQPTAGGDLARLRPGLTRALTERGELVVLSPVHADPGSARPLLEVTVARDAADGQRVGLSLEVDLSALRPHLARASETARITVVDGEGHAAIDTGAAADQPGTDQRARAVVRDVLARLPGGARRYVDGPRTTIAAYASVGTLGWAVIVERDATAAFAPARRMRLATLGGTLAATALAILLAGLFAGRLTRALGRLADGARAFGQGQLELRVPAAGGDEIGALGTTLNAMAGELAASREEILRWNRELEARVEERTKQLKDAQAQLVQAQKLAALGQLGAGVAHEINNPLAGVIGHVQLLLAGRGADDADAPSLRKIEEAARRASAIVQNLQRFSVQHAAAAMGAVDLNRVARETLSLTEQAIRDQTIAVVWQLDERAPRARGDAGQVAQVLLNLVQNARTAMQKSGGTLTIETVGATGPSPVVADRATREVALRVRDTGKGIAPEQLGRIFEPFFTTKEEWSNVGLGLSVSYRIVEEHGGRIAVESEVGRGSTFTVYLPAADAG